MPVGRHAECTLVTVLTDGVPMANGEYFRPGYGVSVVFKVNRRLAAMTEDVDGPCGDCTSADIRAELERVVASPQFEASERNRRFLVYVIEETLAGRAGRIKAYNIATDVFGRDANFDPQLDPVVRMEARRLRRSLEGFYLTEGKSSPLRIAMPKGGMCSGLSGRRHRRGAGRRRHAGCPERSRCSPPPHFRCGPAVRCRGRQVRLFQFQPWVHRPDHGRPLQISGTFDFRSNHSI